MSPLSKVQSHLPAAVRHKVGEMSLLSQNAFVQEFERRRRSCQTAYLLFIFGGVLGLYYLYFKKPLLFFFFLFTMGGLLIWWLIDLVRIPRMVRDYNQSVALEVLRDVQVLRHDRA